MLHLDWKGRTIEGCRAPQIDMAWDRLYRVKRLARLILTGHRNSSHAMKAIRMVERFCRLVDPGVEVSVESGQASTPRS